MAGKDSHVKHLGSRIVGFGKQGRRSKRFASDIVVHAADPHHAPMWIEVKSIIPDVPSRKSWGWVLGLDKDRDVLKRSGIDIRVTEEPGEIGISGGTVVGSTEGWGIELTREGAKKGRDLGTASLRRAARHSDHVSKT